jgi:mannose-6-phosphate isomerase
MENICSCKFDSIMINNILRNQLNSDKTTKKPWGFEFKWAEESKTMTKNHYVSKIIHVCPKKRLSLQYHKHKTETMLCLEGRGFALIGEDQQDLKSIDLIPGKILHVKKGTIHRLHSCQTQHLTILETSGFYDEVVRLHDDYGR